MRGQKPLPPTFEGSTNLFGPAGDAQMIRIAERNSRFGVITIFQAKRTGSLIYSQGGFFQSEADCNGISLASYIHAIYGLLYQAESQNILMIGCGGGTLATMLSKEGRDVTVVDVN